MKLTIGICNTQAKYPNYPTWIKGDDDIEIIMLSNEQQNAEDLQKCQGLVLTGGVDVDPAFYSPDHTDYPNRPKEWDQNRDVFEMALFRKAVEMQMPVLGICRGLQLVNIAMGGTLLQDIESSGKPDHRSEVIGDRYHSVVVKKETLLSSLTGVEKGTVNSAHHQAIGSVASELMVNVLSSDGILEGLEWKIKENKSPLLCTQWHPERMNEKETNPLSKNIREWFLKESEKYKQ